MSHMWSGIAVLALVLPAARADEKSVDELEKLEKEFSKAVEAYEKELDAAKTDEQRKEIEAKDPGPGFAEKFLSFAKKHSKEKAAFDALVTAMGASGGPQNKDGCWSKVLRALERDHVERPEIAKVIRDIASSDDASLGLLRAIMEKNSEKKTQARACKTLVLTHREMVEAAERLKKDESLRKSVEKARGKDYVETLLAKAEKSKNEADELAKLIEGKYAGLVFDTSIGKAAPEITSVDLDGKKVKLSDLKGKVVVLDIWATWCGPCRAMIPHSRKLVERLKEKPFVLVSISADDDAKTVQNFLKKNPMPWTHWFNGAEGGVIDDWDVDGFPTIVVIDAKGVIRFKDVREKELDEAVDKLLKEVDKK